MTHVHAHIGAMSNLCCLYRLWLPEDADTNVQAPVRTADRSTRRSSAGSPILSSSLRSDRDDDGKVCIPARLRVCSQTGRCRGQRVLNIIRQPLSQSTLSPSIRPAIGIVSATGRETRTRARSYPPAPSGLDACQGTPLRVRACVRPAATRTRSRARAAATEAPAATGRTATCRCWDRRPSCVVVAAPPTPHRAVDASPLCLCVPSTTSGRCRLVVAARARGCLRAHVVPRGATGTGKCGQPPVAASSVLVVYQNCADLAL